MRTRVADENRGWQWESMKVFYTTVHVPIYKMQKRRENKEKYVQLFRSSLKGDDDLPDEVVSDRNKQLEQLHRSLSAEDII